MRGRILIGVAAWLLGAGAATGGSLLAVSLLGQGMTGFSGPQLAGATISQAPGAEPAESADPSAPSAARSGTAPSPAKTPRPRRKPAAAPTVTKPKPTPTPTPSATAPDASPQAAATGGTVLTSQGGEVVAACEPGGAYLISWSPQQGYEVDDVFRGPAARARVSFESGSAEVTMTIVCVNGVPALTSASGTDDS